MKKIDGRGSLELWHDSGNEREPETFLVKHRDNEDLMASLQTAREWFEMSDTYGQTVKLNGSQAVTVKLWYDEYL